MAKTFNLFISQSWSYGDAYERLIALQIKIAKRDFSKTIVAAKPWGTEQVSSTVREAADVEATWNIDPIIGGICSAVI